MDGNGATRSVQHHAAALLFYIVVQDFQRYTAEKADRIAVTGFQRVVAHLVSELDIKHSTEPQRSNGQMHRRLVFHMVPKSTSISRMGSVSK